MGFSEIVAMILVYSVLFTFFVVPFQNESFTTVQGSFIVVFRQNLSKLLFHKKSIFAFILLIFTLAGIWLGYDTKEYHFNAHSGYPPISTDLQAIYTMTGIFVYTVFLYVFLVFVKTLKMTK